MSGSLRRQREKMFEIRNWMCSSSQTVSNWFAKYDDEIMRELKVLMILIFSEDNRRSIVKEYFSNSSSWNGITLDDLTIHESQWTMKRSLTISYLEEVCNEYCSYCKTYFMSHIRWTKIKNHSQSLNRITINNKESVLKLRYHITRDLS